MRGGSLCLSLACFCGFLLLGSLVLGGCRSGTKRPGLEDLKDPLPVRRIRAIKWAGQSMQTRAVPDLVDNLDHDDPAVRFYAIASLRQITAQTYGYDYKADSGSRREAIARWRRAISEPGDSLPERSDE